LGIVIISGQVGSSGDRIGAVVAERLRYQLVDRAQIYRMAQDRDPDFKESCSQYEAGYNGTEQLGFFERNFFRSPAYTSLFESLHYELASLGNTVILGRGPQILLRDMPGILKVRTVAPIEWRATRISEEKRISFEEAYEFIEKFDQQRRALMQSVYDTDLSLALYDMVLNVQSFPSKISADFVCEAIAKIKGSIDEEDVMGTLAILAIAKRVESRIKKKIVSLPYRHVDTTAAQGGVVTLSGYVLDKRSKDLAGMIALETEGVTRVENNLKTTELSH
jgi:cytidylate kinase